MAVELLNHGQSLYQLTHPHSPDSYHQEASKQMLAPSKPIVIGATGISSGILEVEA